LKLSVLAEQLGVDLEGDPHLEITGLAGLEDAGPTELSFVSGPRYARALKQSRAGAVLAPPGMLVAGRSCLRSPSPYSAFARAVPIFYPAAAEPSGVHPTAVVSEDAELGPGVAIGPYAVVGPSCRVGARTRIHAHAVLYGDATLGADCVVHAHVAVHPRVRIGDRVVIHAGAVIGSEGFGFTLDSPAGVLRIPHRAGVEIADDVEIGAHTTVDAAHPGHPRLGHPTSATRIGRAVKIDNQVQVGHGCVIGDETMICAQVGLAGCTVIGRGVYIAGQSGTKGHVRIADGGRVGGATSITADVEPGAFVLGVVPAVERRAWARIVASWKRLPELLGRVRALEERAGVRSEKPDPAPETE
jgi:UDP-3-O-[3-hydroxymyristoyl] glucosamine N-acyltransferase